MKHSIIKKIGIIIFSYILIICVAFYFCDSIKENPTVRYSLKSISAGLDYEQRMFKGHSGKKSVERITKPFLTKKDLDKIDLKNVNKLMIVAHPDDETLWGGVHLIKDNYLVLCLTNGKATGNVRYDEINKVLNKTHDKGIILSYPDAYKLERVDWGKAGFIPYITEDIKTVITYKKWDEIVTHNPEGEYGHIHHIYTNNITTKVYKKYINKNNLYYFTRYYKKGDLFKVEDKLKKLPQAEVDAKMDLLDLYASQPGAFVKYGQMIKYEKFINAKDFKNSI